MVRVGDFDRAGLSGLDVEFKPVVGQIDDGRFAVEAEEWSSRQISPEIAYSASSARAVPW
jgi:hypothetical protein